MLFNNVKFFSAIALVGLFSVAACGDDDEETTTTTTTTSSTTTGGGSSGVAACTEACTFVYQCGAANGGELCPSFAPGGTDQDTFLNGPNGDDGCIVTCGTNPLLEQLVNPDDCAATIQSLSIDMAFAASCGAGEGGGGGGAGGGNAGGAGGS
ncbi:MAG: hypothetical protein AAF928_13290 [Myxococcota bacterium]